MSFLSEAVINVLLEKEMLLLLLLHSIVSILKLLITFYSEITWQTAYFKFKFLVKRKKTCEMTESRAVIAI